MTKQTMWRTLVRVVDCRRPDGMVVVCIPARDGGRDPITIPESEIPDAILGRLAVDYRLHARANWGEELIEDIEFEGWEYD